MVLNLFLPSFLIISSQRSLDYSAWLMEDHLNMCTFPFELDALWKGPQKHRWKNLGQRFPTGKQGCKHFTYCWEVTDKQGLLCSMELYKMPFSYRKSRLFRTATGQKSSHQKSRLPNTFPKNQCNISATLVTSYLHCTCELLQIVCSCSLLNRVRNAWAEGFAQPVKLD